MFSFLAGRPRFRPESVFPRCHLVILGVPSQPPSQPRALPACRGLALIVGPIRSQRPFTSTRSKFADDSRFTGRGYLLRISEKGTGGAQWHTFMHAISSVPPCRPLLPATEGSYTVYYSDGTWAAFIGEPSSGALLAQAGVITGIGPTYKAGKALIFKAANLLKRPPVAPSTSPTIELGDLSGKTTMRLDNSHQITGLIPTPTKPEQMDGPCYR